MFYVVFSCLVFPHCVAAGFAALDPAAAHANLREAVVRRNYPRAITLLEEIKRAQPALYTLNNYDYLYGRLAQQQGDLPAATTSYKSVVDRNTILSPFALRHLAEMANQQKYFKAEQSYLQRLLADYPGSPAARGASMQLAESYEESGNYSAAASGYRLQAGSNRETQGKLALSLRRAGQVAEARAIFLRLLQTGKDDQALLAAEQLDDLGQQTLAEAEHLARGRLYLANRHSEGAIAHFQVVVSEFPHSRALPEVLYGLGRAHYMAERWQEAIVWYDRVHREFPASDEGQLGFYQAGHALQNAGRYQEAVARYEAFLKEYPQSEYAGGAHLNAIDSLRLAGDLTAALAWCDRAEKRFAGEVTAVTALFDRAKMLLGQGQIQSALSVFTLLQNQNLSRRAPGSTNQTEVAFMRAYCIEQMGLYPQALELYLNLPDERNRYYGQRATERMLALRGVKAAQPALDARLKEFLSGAQAAFREGNYSAAKSAAGQALRLTDDGALRNELFDMLKTCYRKLPAYARAWNYQLVPVGRQVLTEANAAPARRSLADELCFLGLYDEGVSELTAPRSGSPAGDWNYSLAVYANLGSQGWRALDYGERVFGDLPGDFRLELMPREVAELLFPAPYRDALTQAARPRRVDPRLLLAIARQESRFKPWVKSPVAARGLFQFIDLTADRIARELKVGFFSRDDLYDPKTAGLFGAQYVSDLSKLFPNHPQAVVASYNGGESGAKRWLLRAGSRDVDRFTPEVGYVESKDYVYIVMSNYRAYQQLYKNDLTSAE